MTRAFALVLVSLLAAAAARAQPVPDDSRRIQNQKSDYELEQEQLNWKEGEVRLPAYPKDVGLIPFFVSGASSFRFFIDPASLSPGN
jgi:hypothetical protein